MINCDYFISFLIITPLRLLPLSMNYTKEKLLLSKLFVSFCAKRSLNPDIEMAQLIRRPVEKFNEQTQIKEKGDRP